MLVSGRDGSCWGGTGVRRRGGLDLGFCLQFGGLEAGRPRDKKEPGLGA